MNENEHDDWLRAALRHAPDADVAPPAPLRAAILARARASVPPPRSLRARIEALFAALVRPPVTAALASLVMCTVLVVLWRSGALDEGLDARPQAPSPAAEPAALPVPAVKSPPAPAAAPAASLAQAAEGEATRNARKPSPPRRETDAAQQYAPPAVATQPMSSPAPVTAPAPATVPAPAPAAPAPPQADGVPRAALRAESRARAAQEADSAARVAESSPSITALAPTASPVAEAAFDPLQALRRRGNADSALQWTVDGRDHAHAEAQRAWLAALDAAAGRHWRRDDEPAAANATTLRLKDGERLLAEFALGADRVRIALPGGAWVVMLDPAQAAQLRASVQGW